MGRASSPSTVVYNKKSQEMGPGLRNVQLSKTNSADNPQYLQMTQFENVAS